MWSVTRTQRGDQPALASRLPFTPTQIATPARCWVIVHAALGFLSLEPRAPEVRLLHRWLDSRPGIGHVVAGMARQGYDLELRRYDGQGWRAMFFPSGFEHSLTPHAGSAWAQSPWEAVQRAAGDALIRLQAGEPTPRDWTTLGDSPA